MSHSNYNDWLKEVKEVLSRPHWQSAAQRFEQQMKNDFADNMELSGTGTEVTVDNPELIYQAGLSPEDFVYIYSEKYTTARSEELVQNLQRAYVTESQINSINNENLTAYQNDWMRRMETERYVNAKENGDSHRSRDAISQLASLPMGENLLSEEEKQYHRFLQASENGFAASPPFLPGYEFQGTDSNLHIPDMEIFMNNVSPEKAYEYVTDPAAVDRDIDQLKQLGASVVSRESGVEIDASNTIANPPPRPDAQQEKPYNNKSSGPKETNKFGDEKAQDTVNLRSNSNHSFDEEYHNGIEEKYGTLDENKDNVVVFKTSDGKTYSILPIYQDDARSILGNKAFEELQKGDTERADTLVKYSNRDISVEGHTFRVDLQEGNIVKTREAELEKKLKPMSMINDKNLDGVREEFNERNGNATQNEINQMEQQAELAVPDQSLDAVTLTMMHNEQNNIGEANVFSRRDFKSFDETRDQLHELNQKGQLQEHLGLDNAQFSKLFGSNPKELSASELMNRAVKGQIGGVLDIKFAKPEGRMSEQEKVGYRGNLRDEAVEIAHPKSDNELTQEPPATAPGVGTFAGLNEQALSQVRAISEQFQQNATLIGNAAGDLSLAQGPTVQQDVTNLRDNVLDVASTNTHGQLNTTGMPASQNSAGAAMHM